MVSEQLRRTNLGGQKKCGTKMVRDNSAGENKMA